MQNWNQWQLSAGAVASPMPQPPVGYAAPGADPLAVMQAYMQYYNQPAPSGYTAEQWAAAQQQNWAQWQQWQQQYQQWQAQYGEKYQETIKHMSAQNVGLANQVPPLPIVQPPPLPKEDAKPPLPPSTINTYQFTSMPPPHQNNLPLFPVKQNANSAIQPSVQSCPQNPPLPSNQPPLPPENSSTETVLTGKRSSNTISESSSAKKLKVEDEELTEAEKTFDAQFKQWEEQFNKWKQQNANHPDKTQYKQYEAKWTSWREKLIERREQMRRKREQQKQAAVKAEAEKNKSLPGDDKILNLLSSTENQGLINNLLGIGKTLGLTGKQNTNVPPPPPPPPPPPSTQTTVSTVQTTTITPFTQVTSQPTTTQLSGGNIMSSHMNSSSWNSQQWTPQYNPAMSVSSFPGFHSISAVPPPPFGMPPPNFSQPPPNFSAATPNFSAATPNFSQPPPGFPTNDMRQLQNLNTRPPIPSSLQGSTDTNLIGQNERSGQSVPPNSFDPVQSSNYGINDQNRQKDLGAPSERFGRDGINKNLPEQQGNQFRPKDSFAPRNENYKLNDERVPETEHFKRDDRNYKEHGNSQFTPQKANFASSNDRFVHGNERFGLGNDHCGSAGDRFGHANDRFGSGNDRFGNNRFCVGNDRAGSGNDRFGPGTDRIESNNDRFSASNDRFGTNSEHFGPGNDRFNRSNLDRFDQKDTVGNRRDSFLNNPRSFNRNNQFEPPDKLAPELKKLMEKRRAAMDVFKPSFLDSDKSSSVGSLSESFKRIAGDSPFIMKSSTDFTQKEYSGGKGNNFVPCGTSNFSSTGSNSFRMPVDFKSQVGSEFGSRSSTGFGSRNNTFDLRDGPVPPFKGPISSPQHILNSIDCKPDTTNLGNNVATDKDNLQKETVQELSANKNDAPIAVEQAELNELAMTDQKVDDTGSKDRPEDCQLKKDIPLLEKPPWLDAQLPDTLPRKEEKNATEGESIPANFGKPLEQCSENTSNVPVGDKKHLLSSDNDSMSKKSDVLPFMGENDPKPEDLNMEPPPELPNLGPVTTGATSGVTDSVQKPDASFDVKGPPVRSFPINSECFNSRPAFDGSIGPRAMQFRPNVPSLFSPRGPNDGRFPMFEPRGSNAFPFPSPGPSSHQLGPRPPNDGPFAPRNPNDGHFGQRGPNDGQFGPRGPSDGHFGPRGPNDGQFMPRGPNDGQFVPRGPNDGQFSIRGPNDGLFGPRGPNDAQFVPRGPNDAQFGPRGPNDAQFGPRGPNDAQFGPRGPTDVPFVPHGSSNRQFAPARPGDIPFDNRGSTDAQFGPRGSSEGQSGFPGSNVERFFGSRGSSDGSPYQRGSNDNVFGPRGVNDIQFPSRNSMDGPYGPRNFNDRQFDTPNDGHHGPQGTNDRYLGGRNMPGGPIDAFNSRLPFGARGPGEFRARGQFDNSCPKTLREGLNEKHLERSIETGGADIRGNGGSDTGKSTVFDVNDKMQNEKGLEQRQPFDSPEIPKPGWRQSYTKNSFGDTDQRSVQSPLAQTDVFNQSSVSNVEQRPTFAMNKPNILTEKRPEKNTTDSGTHSSIGDFSNMFMKRPIDNRQSQMRCPPVKEFCIEKQFNYNHGGATPDKKFIEHVPVKIIDYAHTSRSSMQDYLTPVQCFDYGHGNLKPAVSDRETQPKKDFRHWEENEQNLKDYTERIRRYEYFVEKEDTRRSVDYNQRRDGEGSMDERRSDRERREKEDYKVKERGEDRMFDRVSDKDHNSRYKIDKSNSKERTQERCDTSQKEANKENNKDEDRSKGNINWQDSPNKNITEIKPQDTSVPDTQHNVLESAPKTLELAKTPNCTMVDDLLCPPGRQNRPPKIAIILRGPPGSGKSFVAKLIKDKEVEQGGSAPRILSLDDYFLVEKEIESKDDNGKKVIVKDMVYEYEEAMEPSYITSLVKAFKKNITDGFFNFIILDCINEKISDYEEMWSFAKTKGFKVYVCEMEMDVQICLKRNIHNRTEEEINRIIDYFEPTPSYHQKLDVNSMLQEQAIEEVHMEDSEEIEEKESPLNEDSQDSQDDAQDMIGVSKWERMEADDKLDRLDGLAKKKNEGKVQTMKDFLQVPDYYNMEDTSGKKRVRWADLEERKEQEKMRAVGFVVGHTNWDRMMDPTKGGSALTRTKFFSLS